MKQKERGTDGVDSSEHGNEVSGMMLKAYSVLNKLVTRNLNEYYASTVFQKVSRDDISKYLRNPEKYEKQLRDAIIYIYGASSHFRRLIQYFVGLTDLSYVVEPFKTDPKTANVRITGKNYRMVLNVLSSMNLSTQIPKILTVVLREDVYYGTLWNMGDTITIQQLPSDYCKIQSVQGNVPNVTFNFSYFDRRPGMLDSFPPEFRLKYEQIYKKSRRDKWIELDAPNSFAIKCNADILDYAIPPFAGILREIYDIEDYKQLKKAKTAIDNYAMIAMTIPTDDDGRWKIDGKKAENFWSNLDAVLPPEIGSILTPMKLDKISFERAHNGDTDAVAESEQNLYTASGVSSLLFNNAKASANALLLSIKADQAITYGIVKNIGDALNRFLHEQRYGKYFIVNFLDVSPFNRKEVGDAYQKAATYGLPTISAYAASQGIGQAELDSMSFLETEVLELQAMFKPIRSSAQMTGDELAGEDPKAGAPEKDVGDLTDSGEQNREDGDDW